VPRVPGHRRPVRAGGGGGGSNKDVLRLKGELTQRDKEILSLKEELHEKEKAGLEWQERENARNEERVMQAYQRLKGDEKLREKTRKALRVALDLLDESPPEDVSDEELEPLQIETG